MHKGVDEANTAYALQVEAEGGNEWFDTSRKEKAGEKGWGHEQDKIRWLDCGITFCFWLADYRDERLNKDINEHVYADEIPDKFKLKVILMF